LLIGADVSAPEKDSAVIQRFVSTLAIAPVLCALPYFFCLAHAQETTANPPVESAPPIIDTVEVAAEPGPGVWHAVRGDSEVWILGTVGAMPKTLSWNRNYLSELLDGSKAILTPPGASVGIMEGTWLLITYGSKTSLPRGETLEAGMPVELRARFVATRSALGLDEDRYRTDTPIRAAIRLQQDFMRKAGFTGAEPMDTIRKLARDKKVPAKPVAMFEAAPLVREGLDLNLEQQRVCLSEVMDDIDGLSAHGAAAAHAWAVGNISELKANMSTSSLFNCLAAETHAFAALSENTTQAFASAIDAALDKPGKTIAVIDVTNLLRPGGVLAQLQMRHIEVEMPKE
jgi:hypothetical protein